MPDWAQHWPLWAQILGGIALFISGGGTFKAVTILLDYLKDRRKDEYAHDAYMRKERRRDWLDIVNRLEKDRDEAREEITALREQVMVLTARVAHLEVLSMHELPVPIWSVDRECRVQWVSQAFCAQVLNYMSLTESEVIGRTSRELWGDTIEAVIDHLHKASMRSPRGQAVAHNIKIKGVRGEWSFYKFMIKRGAVFAGWYGMVIPVGDTVTVDVPAVEEKCSN